MDKDKRDTFFLFKITKGNLQKDERRGLSKLFMSFVIIFIAIDLGMLVYYQKTKYRMEKMMSHEYTNLVRNNIEESTTEHYHYADNAKQTIKRHHDDLRLLLDNLEFNNKELGHINLNKLKGIESLRDTLKSLANNQNDPGLWSKASVHLKIVSDSMKHITGDLSSLKEFSNYNANLERSLSNVMNEIKTNLDGFLGKLLEFAAKRNQDQQHLYTQMIDTLKNFNTTYDGIVKDNKYVKLNNYYVAKPIAYDKNYVPFSIEFDNKYFGAKLTIDADFIPKLPRVYFCNLRAYLVSEGQFDVKFQYVDGAKDGGILFESENIRGGNKESASFDEYFTFDLTKAHHSLYLRVVSFGSSTKLHIEKLYLECLSYRNFVE